MEHSGLVEIAYNWLLKKVGCSFALKELKTYAAEQPDVIGWKNGRSILVECKASRGDFLADRKKKCRQTEQNGMGNYRLYLTPRGLLTMADIPEKWGWLEVDTEGLLTERIAPRGNVWGADFRFQSNQTAEIIMLCSALRRVHLAGALQSNL